MFFNLCFLNYVFLFLFFILFFNLCFLNSGDDGPRRICRARVNRPFRKLFSDKCSKLGPHVFERLVCLKYWIDADERMQHRDEESSSAADTEESGTELQSQANSDSDGAEESEQ